MDKKVFKENLIKTLAEIGIDATTKEYIIYPIQEEGKKYNSKDDFVRLNVFPLDKISNCSFSFEEVINRFSVFAPYYPLWIDVYLRDDERIDLYTSFRFRKPSELQRKETGHPPFMFMK